MCSARGHNFTTTMLKLAKERHNLRGIAEMVGGFSAHPCCERMVTSTVCMSSDRQDHALAFINASPKDCPCNQDAGSAESEVCQQEPAASVPMLRAQ
jgi:hypothetical protein